MSHARAIENLATAIGVPCSDAAAIASLVRFAELVERWSAKTSLVSEAHRGSAADLAEVLFADALVLASPDLVPTGGRLVDVGSGAGAPAIPLLVLRPDLDGTLVEPRRKRVAFLRTALGALGLAGRARVVEAMVSEKAPFVAGVPFDVAISRATLAPPDWLRMGLALAREAIVLTAREAPPAAGDAARVVATREYALPSSSAPRRITRYAQS